MRPDRPRGPKRTIRFVGDRLYLLEVHAAEGGLQEGVNAPKLSRRIFVLTPQGETLQVYPIPARQWNSFSSGDLFCFDGKLLVPMQNSDDPLDIVALARMPLPPARWPRST